MLSTTLDLLRHGEPQGGIRFRGCGVDDALSEKGWKEMWGAVSGPGPWTCVYTSPMQRCKPFAQAIAERHGLPLIEEPRVLTTRPSGSVIQVVTAPNASVTSVRRDAPVPGTYRFAQRVSK